MIAGVNPSLVNVGGANVEGCVGRGKAVSRFPSLDTPFSSVH